MTPSKKYQADLSRTDFVRDAAQANAVAQLQRLYDELMTPREPPRLNLWQKLTGKQAPPPGIRGLYFWGGVGRGKTYLVDTFYDCLPFDNKLRVHFHRFMVRVHDELKTLKGQSDPLKIVAERLARDARVICFDEFFVSDITDAMILGTLFQYLFGHGVILVATSNIPPDELYRNGLQRARFLPAIALIKANCEVVNVDSGIDYRLRTLEQAEIYHAPLDAQARTNLEQYFARLTNEPGNWGGTIEINHRRLKTVAEGDGVLYIEFQELCCTPRSQLDYIELARCYHSVLLANVVPMGLDSDDAARRFIAMVDEFYERHVKLIISAAVPMEQLYGQGRLSFEFRRCLSRLTEMQSHEYLAREHLP
ncbi:cell division protein ZapE [Zobellella endophytica]|uniref:Cell division protein ZapE n=1 Tax=Zobellella endophytica TaxID=2116700 RepID=A0A2P7R8Z3_9GAMM|nr:cell division protein ZapE [Zobellella endophytica]PSJ46697.1 cell division protein ZapE [Zobellella endophytica]